MPVNQLCALLKTATDDCNAYIALLDQEQQALIKSDLVNLEKILHEKSPLLQRLAGHDQQIADWCQHHADNSDPRQLKALVVSIDEPELQEQYGFFVTALELCQSANLRNARLMHHSQSNTQRLLDLLRNQGETSRNLYDRQGLTPRGSTQRPIDKA